MRVAVVSPDPSAGQGLVEAVGRLAPALRLETMASLDAALDQAGSSLHALVLDDEATSGNLSQAVIAAASRAPQIPIVLLVSPARLDAALQALPLGAAHVVLKRPPHEHLLAVALHQVIGQRRLLIEIANLRGSEARLRSIVESLPAPVAVIAPDGTCLAMNWAGLGVIGAARVDEIVGQSLPARVAPAEGDLVRAFLTRVAGGERAQIDVTWPTPQGGRETVRIDGVPLRRDDSGSPSALCTLSRPSSAPDSPPLAAAPAANEVEPLRGRIEALEGELDSARSELETARSVANEADSTRAALDALRERTTGIEQALEDATVRLDGANARCTELERTAEDERHADETRRAALEERVAALEAERDELLGRVEHVRASEAGQAEAEARANSLAVEIERLGTETERLDAGRARAASEAEHREQALASELARVQSVANALEERCRRAEHLSLQLAPVEAALEDARARVAESETRHRQEVEGLDRTILTLRGQLDGAARSATETGQRLVTLDEALAEARSEAAARDAAHTADRERWETISADLQRQIDEASDRTRELEDRAGHLHRSLEEVTAERLRAAQDEVARLTTRLDEETARVRERDAELTGRDETIARLERTLDEANRLATGLRTELDAAAEEAEKRQREAALASECHRDRLETLQAHLGDEQQLRTELESRVRELDSEIITLASDLVGARERCEALERERQAVESRTETDAARLLEERRALEERLERESTTRTGLESRAVALESQLRGLEEERRALDEQHATLGHERAALERQCSTLAQERDQLSQALSTQREAHDGIAGRLSETEARCRTLEDAASRAEVALTESRDTVKALQDALAAREQERLDAATEAGRLDRERYSREEADRAAYERLEAESRVLREQVVAAETALATLRANPPRDERQRRALTHALEARQRLEHELAKAQGQLRRLFSCDVVARAVTTFDGRMVRFNAAFARLFGYGSGTEETRAVLESIAGREALNARLHLEGRVSGVSLSVRRADGRTCSVIESAVVVKDPGEAPVVERTFIDVTHTRSLETELRRVRRLEAVGRMAGGLAEELAACLSTLDGACHLVSETLPENDLVKGEADRAAAAARRAKALAEQLRAYGVRQSREPVPLDLSVILSQAEPVLRRLAGEDLALEICPGTDVSLVSTDRQLLDQALTSLVVVARDLLPAGGTVRITTVDETERGSADAGQPHDPGAPCLVVTANGYGCRPPGDLSALEMLTAECGGRLRADVAANRVQFTLGLPAVPPAIGPPTAQA